MKPFLLCTDLDRTLLPNGAQPASPSALALFRQLAENAEVTLAYVTGRHRSLIEQAIEEFGLPIPDFAIADVGTTIYRIDGRGWQQMEEWDELLAPDWRGLVHNDLCNLLSVFPLLRPQEAERQNLHKLSYTLELENNVQDLLDEVGMLLKYANVRANLVWSVDEQAGTGLLDVIPSSAGKLQAIHFLMQQKGFHHENTVFAGDSGNDLDVLMSPLPSVLVANASPDIRQLASEHAGMNSLYIARGGYLGMNGNYCAGILEGLAHYLPDVDAWLRMQGGGD